MLSRTGHEHGIFVPQKNIGNAALMAVKIKSPLLHHPEFYASKYIRKGLFIDRKEGYSASVK
ncbi:hypothetical protein FA012_004022 [Escherichia coli]|nr:hypothetical protein [Escherichia coli]